MTEQIRNFVANQGVSFWLLLALVVGICCWFCYQQWKQRKPRRKKSYDEMGFFGGEEPVDHGHSMQMERVQLLEQRLNKVIEFCKRLQERNRQMEQTTARCEAAMKAMADYYSRPSVEKDMFAASGSSGGADAPPSPPPAKYSERAEAPVGGSETSFFGEKKSFAEKTSSQREDDVPSFRESFNSGRGDWK